MELIELLQRAAADGASDLHLTVERAPAMRKDGVLAPVPGREQALKASEVEALLAPVLTAERAAMLAERGEIDFSHSLQGVGRFRVSLYRQRGSLAAALRLIPEGVPALESLGLPPAVRRLALQGSGLILVAGPAGSGKSTTMAALIDLINRERACHILTIEDPIEYLHRHRRSLVNQREIGSDTASFPAALGAALRQDADVIAVSALPDSESMSLVLTAAQTGRLVLASMTTQRAHLAIERLFSAFPPYQLDQVRLQLAGCLQGVLAQVLLPKRAGQGRVLACELLVATPAVRNLVREGKTPQLLSLMETGVKSGMMRLESSIEQLRADRVIHEDEYQARMGELSAILGRS